MTTTSGTERHRLKLESRRERARRNAHLSALNSREDPIQVVEQSGRIVGPVRPYEDDRHLFRAILGEIRRVVEIVAVPREMKRTAPARDFGQRHPHNPALAWRNIDIDRFAVALPLFIDPIDLELFLARGSVVGNAAHRSVADPGSATASSASSSMPAFEPVPATVFSSSSTSLGHSKSPSAVQAAALGQVADQHDPAWNAARAGAAIGDVFNRGHDIHQRLAQVGRPPGRGEAAESAVATGCRRPEPSSADWLNASTGRVVRVKRINRQLILGPARRDDFACLGRSARPRGRPGACWRWCRSIPRCGDVPHRRSRAGLPDA